MTVSRRKNKAVAKPDDRTTAESGVQYHCDVCGLDISSTVRISCATCAGHPGPLDTYDLCCSCFLEGAESGNHKAWHDYRVVEQHAYPIFCDDWGADEELLLIDGAQIYGLGNWADIADHIGNRTKEEVERHYLDVYIEGRDGTSAGEVRAAEAVRRYLSQRRRTSGPATEAEVEARLRRTLPVVGPNVRFESDIDAEEFQKRKRRRIDSLRENQAAFGGGAASSQASGSSKPVPPKPLVSAPTSHSELAGFMPGRLEFETEYEQDAENFVKDMEFGKVYKFGGELMPSELEALGGKAEQGKSRMEASGRGGPGLGGRGAKGVQKDQGDDSMPEEGEEKDDEDREGTTAEGKDEEDEKEEGEADEDEDEDDKDDQSVTQDQSQAKQDSQQFDASNAVSASAAAAASSSQAAPAETDDRAADWDEDEADLEIKLMVLDVYNDRLERRRRRKEFIFERNLIDYKRNVAAERKRPKEERELLNRVRHFAQLQTATDFEDFVNGLFYEDALRRAAAQLQSYRRAGITTMTEAAQFETEQAERARKAAVALEGGLAAFPASGAARSASRAIRDTSTPNRDESEASAAPAAKAASKKESAAKDPNKPPRKPPQPMDISKNPSLHLCTRAEQELCSVVRIQPHAFLVMKKEIINEFIRRGGKFTRRESRVLFKCDVNKIGKVYDLLEQQGYLAAAAKLGWNGVGVPPGWKEKPSKTPLPSLSASATKENSHSAGGSASNSAAPPNSGSSSKLSHSSASMADSPSTPQTPFHRPLVNGLASANSHNKAMMAPRSATAGSDSPRTRSPGPGNSNNQDGTFRGRPTAFT